MSEAIRNSTKAFEPPVARDSAETFRFQFAILSSQLQTDASDDRRGSWSMAACQKCGLEYSPGKKFCRQCGNPLVEPPAETNTSSPDTISCPTCHNPAPLTAKFCRACGAKLVGAPETAVASVPAIPSPSGIDVQQARAVSPRPVATERATDGYREVLGSKAPPDESSRRSDVPAPQIVATAERRRGALRVGTAIAAVLIVAVAGWLVVVRLLPLRGPGEDVLKTSLASQIPTFTHLDRFEIETSRNVGSWNRPDFDTRFLGTLVLTADTFAQSSVEDGITFIAPKATQGTTRELRGVAHSVRTEGRWMPQFDLGEDLASSLGQPKELFTGSRVIVQGSPEDTAFRNEQREAREAGERRAQALLAQQVETEQRRLEKRQAIEHAQTEADAAALAAALAAARNAESRPQPPSTGVRQESPPPALQPRTPEAREVPIIGELRNGSEFNVRLLSPIDSGAAKVEDRFQAALVDDFKVNGKTLIPAGSLLRGIVSSVESATRTNRTAKMTLSFDLLTIQGHSYPIRAKVTKVIAGDGAKDAAKIGAGAGIGAVIGGIFGGAKGAITGLLIGGGGTLAGTNGNQVELKAGSVVRVRIESATQIG